MRLRAVLSNSPSLRDIRTAPEACTDVGKYYPPLYRPPKRARSLLRNCRSALTALLRFRRNEAPSAIFLAAKYIYRSILIPVMVHSALGARPFSVFRPQLIFASQPVPAAVHGLSAPAYFRLSACARSCGRSASKGNSTYALQGRSHISCRQIPASQRTPLARDQTPCVPNYAASP